MPTQNSKNRAIQKYAKNHYSRVIIQVPIAAKEALTAKAAEQGVSINRYVLEAVEEKSGLKLTLDRSLPWIEK